MSSLRDIRLIALWRDDPLVSRLTLDVRVDIERRRVASQWDVFGAFDLDGAKARPFILRRDGAIDFGALARHPGWRTNIRETEIAVGGRFHLYWNETDRGEYEIVKIAALGAKDLSKDSA